MVVFFKTKDKQYQLEEEKSWENQLPENVLFDIAAMRWFKVKNVDLMINPKHVEMYWIITNEGKTYA